MIRLKIVESSLLDFLVSSLWRFLLLTAPSIPLMTHTPFDLCLRIASTNPFFACRTQLRRPQCPRTMTGV